MQVTREQIINARTQGCVWSAEAIAEAIGNRFPGDGPIVLEELIDSWLGDKNLNHGTLVQCAILAASVAGQRRPQRAIFDPRGALNRVKAAVGGASDGS